ncbi:hypothetical protein Q3G72_007482 [Acer saccharum]|nr:hypothetical protein Q3G72_007482 [Acer saccharum]
MQDSLSGNSKTMIIANINPYICCAAGTLNTLTFAQRAKLIQNNAMVNEDSTGDVNALQHQIRPLKESASNTKDKKDEIKEMVASLEALEDDLELKSSELAQVVAHSKRNRLSEIIHLSSPTNTRTDENIHSPTIRVSQAPSYKYI